MAYHNVYFYVRKMGRKKKEIKETAVMQNRHEKQGATDRGDAL